MVVKKNSCKVEYSLLNLKNAGWATLEDLHLLGIFNVHQLKNQSAESLFLKLEMLTGLRQDPCVQDIFNAIIHEANTGEKLPWWFFSKIRKSIKC